MAKKTETTTKKEKAYSATVKGADLKPVKKRATKAEATKAEPTPKKPRVRKPPFIFDVTRHNAFVEIISPYTLNTAYLKVVVQPANSKFFPSERLAYFLVGNNPESPYHWRAFARIDEFGAHVFRTCMGTDTKLSKWEKLAGMLERPAFFTEKGCKYNFTLID